MIGHRTCIICLPRTGGQLCEQLSGEVKSSLGLGEYFENWNRSEYSTYNNKIKLTKYASVSSGFSIFENFEERLNLLKNTTQSLTLRIFLMDYYDKTILSTIILELKNMGFEFLTLTRDIKEQLLSYMITHSHTHTYAKNVFGLNSKINSPVYIDLNPVLKSVLIQMCDSHRLWEENLSIILPNIEYQKVRYESIYSDMEKIYDTKFKYLGEKSIKTDPLDLIINEEEVVRFLVNNTSGL